MAGNDDTWEGQIERARRLRDAVAAGGQPELGEEERDIVVEALDGWLALAERHLAEVRRKLPAGDEPATSVPGPGPDEGEALRRQITDRYRDEDQ